MAEETELLAGGPELESVGRLMGVVAVAAKAFLDGRVNVLFLISSPVALVTEASHVLDGFEFMLPGGLMAEGAVSGCRGTVNVRFRSHLSMALVCYAGGLFDRFGVQWSTEWEKDERQAE